MGYFVISNTTAYASIVAISSDYLIFKYYIKGKQVKNKGLFVISNSTACIMASSYLQHNIQILY